MGDVSTARYHSHRALIILSTSRSRMLMDAEEMPEVIPIWISGRSSRAPELKSTD